MSKAKVDVSWDEPVVETPVVEEAPVAEVVVETPVEVASSEVMEITLDIDDSTIVSSDEKGLKLLFNEQSFRPLSREVISKLSYENKQRYFLAHGAWEYTKGEETAEVAKIPNVEVSARFASATSRLEIRNKLPGWHYAWKRTDELHGCLRDGYVIADEESLATLDSSPSGLRKVTARGEDELVALRLPEDEYKRREAEKLKRNQALANGPERELERELSAGQLKGSYYDPQRRRGPGGPRFSAPQDANGTPLQNS